MEKNKTLWIVAGAKRPIKEQKIHSSEIVKQFMKQQRSAENPVKSKDRGMER